MIDLSKIPQRLQSGFSLIEVLVSLLVLGVGLLGLGGLQITALKSSGNAHSRSVASMLALDLSDRMRANSLGVAGGFYDDAVNCDSAEKSCRNNTFCSPQEVALYDIQEVMCGVKRSTRREGGVANLLFNGGLQVTCPGDCAAVNETHNIVITWGDRSLHLQQVENIQAQILTVPVIP